MKRNNLRILHLPLVLSLSLVLVSASWVTPGRANELPEQLIVTNSSSWEPFAFLDADGEPQGILIDLWREFGKRNDVEIVFELVDWEASLDLVRDGEADVHAGLIASPEREDFMLFSQELFKVRGILFVSKDLRVTGLANIGAIPVGVVGSSYEEEFVKNQFAAVRTQVFPDNDDLIRAAVDGKIQAFITDDPTGYYHLVSLDRLNLFSARPALYTRSVQAGIDTNSGKLLELIDAGFEKISEEERMQIKDRWLIPGVAMPPWLLPLAVTALAISGLGGLTAHHVSLRRTVGRKTAELKASLEELERIARTDSLTGVHNRGSFNERLEQELERAKRYLRPLSLILLDLDRFKHINDSYGHLAGDEALKYFASTTAAHLRSNDLLARIGGDEFGIILPETLSDEATRIVERVQDELHHAPVEHDGHTIRLSYSAGISEYRGEGTADELLKQVDDALYRSKAQGRSQVTAKRSAH